MFLLVRVSKAGHTLDNLWPSQTKDSHCQKKCVGVYGVGLKNDDGPTPTVRQVQGWLASWS